VEQPGVPRPLRWTFAVFIFSIPFEAYPTGIDRFTISKFAGYIMLLLAFFYPKIAFRRFPGAGWLFLFYILLFAALVPFQPAAYFPENRTNFMRLVQMFVLFWISYNLLRRERMVNLTLGSYAVSCCLLAVLNVFGFMTEEHVKEREAAFGQDPNSVAAMFAVGVLAMVALVYGRKRAPHATRYAVWAMLPIVALAIARTGSRGGLAALAVGLMVIVLRKGTAWVRLRNAVIVAFALGVFLIANFSLEMNRQRWEKTLEGGTMAGRETIFPAAWKLFLEKPLTGWGPATHYKVLGARFFREELDTHNLYLWLLTQVGLFGTIPYLIGLLLCLRSAWRARAGPQGVLPLALMTLALTINMSLTWHEKKVYWVILALALASSQPILERVRRVRRPAARGALGGEPAAGVAAEAS
jgi:O-antigen ligase